MDALLPKETGPQCHVPCAPKWPTEYVNVQSRVVVMLDRWRETIKYGLRASLFQYNKAQVDRATTGHFYCAYIDNYILWIRRALRLSDM